MRLVSITWGTIPRLPGLRPSDTGRILCDNPASPLKDWRVFVRGPQIFFVSPPGWSADQSARSRDPLSPRTVFGPMAASDVYLEWQAETEVEVLALLDGKMKFESPPFGWRPAPPLNVKPFLEQITPSQVGDA